jgi:hypothetical protein
MMQRQEKSGLRLVLYKSMSPYIKNKKERKKIWGVGSKHGALPSK